MNNSINNNIEINQLYALYKKSVGVTNDSRTLAVGQIFFALIDERDGHDYVLNALKSGASLCVVQKHVDVPKKYEKKLFIVENTLKTLQDLARHHRSTLAIPVLAIGGSNGKTTTKELVRSVLQKKYNVAYSLASFNNHIGVPLTILSTTPEHEIAVYELGTNHPGEMKFLLDIAQPTHGIVTNIGKEHLEGFGDLTGVEREESAMYEYITKHNGHCFIPSSLSSNVRNIVNKKNSILYSISKPVYIHGDKLFSIEETISALPFLQLILSDNYDTKITLKTHIAGSVNIHNIATAITIGCFFAVPLKQCVSAIAQYLPTNMRSQMIKWRGVDTLMDCYNANPSSMNAMLADLALIQNKKIVLVIGGMREMGDSELNEHAILLRKIAKLNPHQAFFIGPEFAPHEQYILKHGWLYFENSDAARQATLRYAPPKKSLIFAKGSNGNKVGKFFE